VLDYTETWLDYFVFALPALVALYCVLKGNPYERGTQERKSLSTSRTGLLLALVSIDFGLFGVLLSIISLLLGIKASINDRPGYGFLVISISTLSFFYNLTPGLHINDLIN
jgi:uncharacterized membrane protein YfcA